MRRQAGLFHSSLPAYHGPQAESKLAKRVYRPHVAWHYDCTPIMTAEIVPLPRKQPGGGLAENPTLDPMLGLTASGMNAVNAVILDRMQSEIPLIPALAGHLISGGGKRLRPMLTLAGAHLVGYQGLQAGCLGRIHPHRHAAA